MRQSKGKTLKTCIDIFLHSPNRYDDDMETFASYCTSGNILRDNYTAAHIDEGGQKNVLE